jgi:hypothetical protein
MKLIKRRETHFAKRRHTTQAFGSMVLFIADTVVVVSGQRFFSKSA